MSELEKALGKSQRSAQRKSKPKAPRRVTAAGAQQRAQERVSLAELRRQEKALDMQHDNHRRQVAGRYQTKKQVEQKARADQRAGKIPRGQLQKTIDRRWKATQQRQDKALKKVDAGHAAKKSQLRQDLKDNPPPAPLFPVTVLVTFIVSKDVKTAILTFDTSGDIAADAEDALADYMQSSNAEMIGVRVLS